MISATSVSLRPHHPFPRTGVPHGHHVAPTACSTDGRRPVSDRAAFGRDAVGRSPGRRTRTGPLIEPCLPAPTSAGKRAEVGHRDGTSRRWHFSARRVILPVRARSRILSLGSAKPRRESRYGQPAAGPGVGNVASIEARAPSLRARPTRRHPAGTCRARGPGSSPHRARPGRPASRARPRPRRGRPRRRSPMGDRGPAATQGSTG